MGVTPLMAAAGVGVREPGFGANRAPDFTSKAIESEVIASLEILLDGRRRRERRRHRHSKAARRASRGRAR